MAETSATPFGSQSITVLSRLIIEVANDDHLGNELMFRRDTLRSWPPAPSAFSERVELALHERVVEHRMLESDVECSPDDRLASAGDRIAPCVADRAQLGDELTPVDDTVEAGLREALHDRLDISVAVGGEGVEVATCVG